MQNKQIGFVGEQLASEYLLKNKFQIIERNYFSRWGELDIIAEKNNILVFVEVKTRKSNEYGNPYEAVQYFKIKHILRTIKHYILSLNLYQKKCRLDVISVELNSNNTLNKLRHYENLDTNQSR